MLAASFVFYGYWSRPFLLHFFFVVCANYLFYHFALWRASMDFRLSSTGTDGHWQKERRGLLALRKGTAKHKLAYKQGKIKKSIYSKKALFAILLLNLGNLILFKYFYLLADAFVAVFSFGFLENLGWGHSLQQSLSSLPKIILPLAISFYTFQILAFQIDVYRGKLEEQVPFLHFVLFIMFFPQLIAGPIMRHSEFLPKIERRKRPHPRYLETALLWIFLGFVKKTLVADRLAAWADPVFANPEHFSAKSQLWAVYGFSIRIYCDFSGYTDIARGLALALGFRIPANFSGPYFSRSFREFWRRWHITLSSWLRDYLYIPLGGNRHGRLRMYAALFVTMLLGGLWHGAHWNFLIWGFLHGLFLSGERFLGGLWPKGSALAMPPMQKSAILRRLWQFIKIILVFHFVSLAWVFFRSPTFSGALAMLHSILWELPKQYFTGLITSDTVALAVADGLPSQRSLPFGVEHGLLLLAFLWLHVLEYKFSKLPLAGSGTGIKKGRVACSASVEQGHQTRDSFLGQLRLRFLQTSGLFWPLLGFLAVFAVFLSYRGSSFIYFQF